MKEPSGFLNTIQEGPTRQARTRSLLERSGLFRPSLYFITAILTLINYGYNENQCN
jgi:hypothetical protein